VLKRGTELADVTGEGLVHLSCPFINCSYNDEGFAGHAVGTLSTANAKGIITLTGQETSKETGGKICPPEAFLTITTAPLTAIYTMTECCKQQKLILRTHQRRCRDLMSTKGGFFEKH
jgi:hypothetical protein